MGFPISFSGSQGLGAVGPSLCGLVPVVSGVRSPPARQGVEVRIPKRPDACKKNRMLFQISTIADSLRRLTSHLGRHSGSNL